MMPLRRGPTLFLASGPTSWQARHFLNTSAPSSGLPSCAAAEPKATIASEAARIAFRQACVRLRIIFHLLCEALPGKATRGASFFHATLRSSAPSQWRRRPIRDIPWPRKRGAERPHSPPSGGRPRSKIVMALVSLPEPDAAIVSRRGPIVDDLRRLVG